MNEKLIKVFYGSDLLPYKDKELQVHFPVVGSGFLGASNTTKIRFYYSHIGNADNTYLAVAKLPNGKQGSQLLNIKDEDEDGRYCEMSLSEWYFQAKGDVFIGLKVYGGGVTVEIDEETGFSIVSGSPVIQTTGSIKLGVNYAPIGDVPDYRDEYTAYNDILGMLGDKANLDSVALLVDWVDFPTYQDLFEYVGLRPFIATVDDVVSVCHFEETEGQYKLYVSNSKGIYQTDFLTMSDIINFTLHPIQINDNIVYLDQSFGTLTYEQYRKVQKDNAYIKFNTEYYKKSSENSSIIEFKSLGDIEIINNRIELTNKFISIQKPHRDYMYGQFFTRTYLDTAVYTKEEVNDLIDTIKKDSLVPVDTTTYPTLQDFLASVGEEGDIYLYPLDTTDLTKGYYKYVYENNEWVSLGTTNIDLSGYYTSVEVDTLLNLKADKATTYTKTEVDTALMGKQNTLVSGQTIKTINNQSVLGSGNIDIQGGTPTVNDFVAGSGIVIDEDLQNDKVVIMADQDVVAYKVDIKPQLVSITYSALKTLRNNGTLVKGCFYRITDYECTTTQFDTRSANHQFDIIVQAVSENELSEIARAIKHIGDTYFADCDLNAWELKYCLDNDTTRFAWADEEDGKGVIFYMKDEYGNEAPYDFKNIQFKRYAVSDGSPNGELADLEGQYLGYLNGEMQSLYIPDDEEYIWCYTFCWYNSNDDEYLDCSVVCPINTSGNYANSEELRVRLNNIETCCDKITIDEEDLIVKQVLNNIVFIMLDENEGGLTIKENHICSECQRMSFISPIGNYIDSYCFDIIGGSFFTNNTFGNGCNYNTFGNYCNSNTFGNYCNSNTFGNDCYSNTLLDNANNNESNGYARWNIFEDGVNGITLEASDTYEDSGYEYLQNITIRQGCANSTIVEDRGNTFDTTYRASGSQDKTI